MRKRKDYGVAALFLLPAVLLMVVFVIYPIISNVVLSFQSWKGIFGTPKKFVGWENYIKVITNESFGRSMANAGIFMVVGFLVQMPLSFGLALLVTSKIKGKNLFRTVYYLPVILELLQ